jgi:cobalt-zinc-cadmium efflux system membrane fusion protein
MKKINQFILTISVFLLPLFFTACDDKHTEDNEHSEQVAQHDGHDHDEELDEHSDDDGHNHDAEEHNEGEIHLSKQQVTTMDIRFGEFSKMKINAFVKAIGTLGLPPNALTSVSARSDGFIKNSRKYVEGNYVKKGEVMAYLENPEFIEYQQEYLEIAAELEYDQQELARQKTLFVSNAGIEKNVQKMQSEVKQNTAKLKGLSKRLAYLGIKASDLTTDNIVQRVPIHAPMTGYITSIQMHNGMYVTPEMELMEIVNENHLHLELDVFEKDIALVEEGQRISYSIPALANQIYDGEVHVIGKEFNTENKTVRIHGHLKKERPKFIKDLFVEAKIWLNDQTVQALPENAVIKDGASSYIYVGNDSTNGEEIEFKAIKVIEGTKDNGYTSIKLIDSIPAKMKIVTAGAYYVYAQSKAGELEHEH